MVGKYKTTKTIRGIEAIELREDNIMDVADFLKCSAFYSYNEYKSDYINSILFVVEGLNYVLEFGDYVILTDNGYELYSELAFILEFEKDCDE